MHNDPVIKKLADIIHATLNGLELYSPCGCFAQPISGLIWALRRIDGGLGNLKAGVFEQS